MNYADLPFAKPSNLVEIVRDAIMCGLPWAIPGPSGAGKSELTASIIADLDREVQSGTPIDFYPGIEGVVMMTIMGPQYDEFTLRGIQTFIQVDGKVVTQTADPSWKVQYDELRAQYPNHLIVIFIDELGVMSLPAQASILELINNKRIDQMTLGNPDRVAFLSAYNRQEDGASFFNMSQPLAARFGGHTVFKPDVADFLSWGHRSGKIAPEVDLFLSRNPGEITSYQQHGLAANAVSPRAWEYVCRMINQARSKSRDGIVNLNSMATKLQSRMPAAVLSKFLTDAALSKDMPLWSDVLRDPESAVVPDDLLVQAMALRSFATQISDEATSDAFMVYSNRCAAESIGSAGSILLDMDKRSRVFGLGAMTTVFAAAENKMTGNDAIQTREAADKILAAAAARCKARAARAERVAKEAADQSAAPTALTDPETGGPTAAGVAVLQEQAQAAKAPPAKPVAVDLDFTKLV